MLEGATEEELIEAAGETPVNVLVRHEMELLRNYINKFKKNIIKRLMMMVFKPRYAVP